MPLKAPFPYFGGKSRVADLVWQRFGDVPNYVEPFAGSLAVLLARPTRPQIETVCDIDCFIANFWRAMAAEPEEVASWADWPVNEADLHSRHTWLLASRDQLNERILSDPDYYDPKVAGWWAWGICSWIGGGWCSKTGVHPIPHLANGGRGVHRMGIDLITEFQRLRHRLRRVRVCCGDWTRVLADSVTVANGVTAIFLDPPYTGDRNITYHCDSTDLAHQVREWAVANGENPKLKVALCGYEGEIVMPSSWDKVAWTGGGYGRRGTRQGNRNLARERIWFSPYCDRNLSIFDYLPRQPKPEQVLCTQEQ